MIVALALSSWARPGADALARAEPESSTRRTANAGRVATRPTFTPPLRETLAQRHERARLALETAERRASALAPFPQFSKRSSDYHPERTPAERARLRRLLREIPEAEPDHLGLLWRLASSYVEQREYHEELAGYANHGLFAAEDRGDERGAEAIRGRQRVERSRAREAGETAIELLLAMTRAPRFSSFDRGGMVYGALAVEYERLGRDEDMIAAYTWLLRGSYGAYVPIAYARIGDVHTRRGELERALKMYRRVREFKPSHHRVYALNQSARCHLKRSPGDARARERARELFATAYAESHLEGMPTRMMALERERARRGLIELYADTRAAADAPDYFKRFAGEREEELDEVLEQLAARYFITGREPEARVVYGALASRSPGSRARCRWQALAYASTLAGDGRRRSLQEASRLAALIEALPDARARRCRVRSAAALEPLAAELHRAALASRSRSDFELAEHAYSLLLAVGRSKDAAPRYAYAELLWEDAAALAAGRGAAARRDAAPRFLAAHGAFVAALDGALDQERGRAAARGQLLALENAVALERGPAPRVGCRVDARGRCALRGSSRRRYLDALDVAGALPGREPSAEERQRLAAFERYERHVSDDASLQARVDLGRAELAMARHDFDRARPLLKEVVVKHDGAAESVLGAALLLDALVIAWLDARNTAPQRAAAREALERWARRLQRMRLHDRPDAAGLRRELVTLRAGGRAREP